MIGAGLEEYWDHALKAFGHEFGCGSARTTTCLRCRLSRTDLIKYGSGSLGIPSTCEPQPEVSNVIFDNEPLLSRSKCYTCGKNDVPTPGTACEECRKSW